MKIFLKQPTRSVAMDAAKSNALRQVDWTKTAIGDRPYGGFFDVSDLSQRVSAFDSGRRNESEDEPDEEDTEPIRRRLHRAVERMTEDRIRRSYGKDSGKCTACQIAAPRARIVKSSVPASHHIRSAIARLQDRLAEELAEHPEN